MGCMLPLLEYYGLERAGGGGCHHDNGVAKGAGTASGKGEGVCACDEPGACMSSGASVRAYARAAARVAEGGGGTLSIMVCPLRGNYAESCMSVGGGIIMGCLPPLCVCEVVS